MSMGEQREQGDRVRAATALACLLLVGLALWLWGAPPARAADSVYWSNNSGAIRVGQLSGSGGPQDLFTGESGPAGVAIDLAGGKIYWTAFSGAIRVGNLDGSGSPQNLFTGESNPFGVAVDQAAGKIYWANDVNGGAIRVGNLSGSGAAQNLFPGEAAPGGVAIDPGAGKIYWTNQGSGAIRVGNLNGSGSAQDLFTGEGSPKGVAIDPAAGKIYWSDDGAIRVGNLNGSGSAQDLFSSFEPVPVGIAIDPAAGKSYWANFGFNAGDGALRVGSLGAPGSASNLFAGSASRFLALLRAPQPSAPPQISGSGAVGQPLSCSQGSWAADLPGAQLYRAAQSFAYQWLLNGVDIAGATASTYTPTAEGTFSCRVTATNQAGSASQTSVSPPPEEDPKCRKLRKKLKRQHRKLGNAVTPRKRSQIQDNIKDSRSRQKRLGCN